jgi:hypothetical protein
VAVLFLSAIECTGLNSVGQTEKHTAKPLEPDNCSCDDDTATANWEDKNH